MEESPNYSYLDLLNPQQRDAVVYKDGAALVIAGAGSGKTRVLTYKIVDLIRNGYEPYRIMALTFTNKAAKEMKERIMAITGAKIASRLWMGTFHSIFLRILRHHTEEIGFKPGFTIYDTADSHSLIKIIIKDMGLDEKIYKPSILAAVISNAKNAMITPDLYIIDKDNYNADKRANRPLTGEIYRQYYDRCKVANAMDFDDILVYMNLLLRDFPDICRHYQEFFKYILVDEYQDTNFAQHLIISQLTGTQNKLCVVGDDAQSIYSFRGADIDNILNLERRYPGLKIFKLERNYRSTQNIINAAGSLIEKNTRQMKKNVYSENDKGDQIDVIKTYSDMEEAFMVANMINQSKLMNHDSYDEFAILYRTNAQSRILEESLRKRSIPYRIYGGLSFYQRKEVKDMIAYFRLSVNPNDDEALRRIINYPTRGIGDTTLRKLHSAATEAHKSIWAIINEIDLKSIGLNAGTISKIDRFKQLIQEFIDYNNNGSNAYELGQLIYNRTGILSLLTHDSTPESISRQENLSEIIAGLKEFVEVRQQTDEGEINMRAFLSEVMLATDLDQNENDNTPKVTLMTVHAAKGLEFKHVYVVGVEEDLFPSSMSQESLAQIEEERRLLYVAITRAKTTCTLTYAGSRFRNGQTVMTSPSRFLSDIDTRYLNLQLSSSIRERKTDSGYLNPLRNYKTNTYGVSFGKGSKPSTTSKYASHYKIGGVNNASAKITPQHSAQELSIGIKILHEKFGKGTVTKIDTLSGEEIITVDFGVVGIKRLLLKFAKFDIL
ncbi:MAG: UvrD-helicase domain-containing protein [Bacteroides sp.]|nr:UvrD-helicase domain-containing protein [Bacteroides sp.]